MFANVINSLAKKTEATKALHAEVSEFHAIKAEINKARCVIELDGEGNIIEINENALKSLGYSKDELINQHHRTLIGRAEANGDAYQAFWRGLNSCQTQIGEFNLLDKSGKSIWFQGYYAAVPDSENKLRKVVAYLTDTSKTHGNLDSMENELVRMKQALNNSSIAIMSIDRDFKVIYMNEGTKALFKQHLTELRKFFPSLDPDNMMGTCIDMFHRNPKHQRDMLADPKNLPHTAHIKVGDLYIRLHVTAAFDAAGNYCGNTLEWREVTNEMSDKGRMDALFKVMGIIEFDLTGKIIDVNDNFANVTGYSKAEIIGQHHSMFVDPAYKASSEYKAFWEKLGRGEFDAGQFKRFGKGGKEVWLEASYNPVLDVHGKPYKVIKYATEITQSKMQSADYQGQIEAVQKVMGVIQFDLKGNIIEVNELFANVTGYSVSELVGKHHSMLVDTTYKNSAEYRAFWERLGSGLTESGQYRRIGKDGREIWLQASYNAILDPDGKPVKVVKYATDITEQQQSKLALENTVNDIRNVIEAAETDDLSGRISMTGKSGPIANVCEGVNSLLDKMTEVLVQVREAGETINTAAGEISTGNSDLSSRTEQQASSLEETASSMEELSSTVKQNAENAKQANQLAAAASGVAVKGGEVVGEVVTTMSAINESAKKIEDIISVIDGIAFQTNILALNAAVEAARAGEQGRGFAVVAGEVRNLAQRSASAAKEIKELITDSVSKTADGTKLVESAGSTMQEIVNSVQRVTDIMAEITAASQEQSSGIDQVNQAITSMDETTQQNAALVEEAAAAAESLVEQAANLMQVVSNFKLKGVVQQQVERRAVNSPMRTAAPKAPVAASKPAPQPAMPKVTAKTGTDDGEWEEF